MWCNICEWGLFSYVCECNLKQEGFCSSTCILLYVVVSFSFFFFALAESTHSPIHPQERACKCYFSQLKTNRWTFALGFPVYFYVYFPFRHCFSVCRHMEWKLWTKPFVFNGWCLLWQGMLAGGLVYRYTLQQTANRSVVLCQKERCKLYNNVLNTIPNEKIAIFDLFKMKKTRCLNWQWHESTTQCANNR